VSWRAGPLGNGRSSSAGLKWIRVGEAINPTLEDSGKDAVMVDLTWELPLFRGKYSGAIRGAEAQVAAAEAGRQGLEDILAADVEMTLFDWREADRREDLYGHALLPKAREAWQAAATAYRTGGGGFLDLVETLRTMLDLTLEHERARADRGQAAAALGALTGVDWTEVSS
jgi:outer membrane protein TolC